MDSLLWAGVKGGSAGGISEELSSFMSSLGVIVWSPFLYISSKCVALGVAGDEGADG